MEKLVKSDLKSIIQSIWKTMIQSKEILTELDSAMGDGDLGITMSEGFEELYNKFDDIETEDLGMVLVKLGMFMNAKVPSTMGTLISTCLIKGGKAIRGFNELGLDEIVSAGRAAVNGVMEIGKSKLGEKTMLDALDPAVGALESSSKAEGLNIAFEKAYLAAKEGVELTKEIKSVHGRAAYYGEKSINRPDAGATAIMYIFRGINNYFQS